VQQSDPSALGAFVDVYATELRDLALFTVRSTDAAEDVVQEVFVRLWERRHSIAITGSVIAYLYRMTQNAALNVLRHERASERAHLAARHEYEIHTPAARNTGPWAVRDEELAVALERALSTLQPQVRTVFLMTSVQGMSYAEVAAALGIARTTVRSQMSRAIRQLAPLLRGDVLADTG
jgi:RNA polymerase sigma-70 factor (ECF subfamily)